MPPSTPNLSLTKLRKTLTYVVQAPEHQIQADLKLLATFDQEAEIEQAKFSKLGYLAFACAIGSIFISSWIPQLSAILTIGFLGLAAYASLQASHHGRLNVPNYRYEALQSILELLGRDIDPNQPFKVRLGLSPTTNPNKKVKPKRGVKVIGNRSFFADQWLTIISRLADKTSFTLLLNESYQIKHKRKGRTSHKPKGIDLTLVLAYPTAKYQQIDQIAAAQAQQAIRLPPGSVVKSLRFQKQRILLKVKAPSGTIYAKPENFTSELRQVVMMMFLSSYQILNLARKLTPSLEKA